MGVEQPVKLRLKVTPKASRTSIAGWRGEELKIMVTAPPDKGKANIAVAELLAKTLGVPKSAVTITAGHSSQRKTVAITGTTLTEVRRRLDEAANV